MKAEPGRLANPKHDRRRQFNNRLHPGLLPKEKEN